MSQSDFDAAERLISTYKNKYKEKYDKYPVFNRRKIKYELVEILQDYDLDFLNDLIIFFVKTDRFAEFSVFLSTYDKLIQDKERLSADVSTRKALMDSTRKSVEEFRKGYGNGAK